MKIVTFSELGRMGELGNQMFQVASTIGYADMNKSIAIFPEWKCAYSGTDYSKIFKYSINQADQTSLEVQSSTNLPWKHYHYHDLKFIQLHQCDSNINLVGYFQSELYFNNVKDNIRKLFIPNDEIAQYIQTKYPDIITDNDYICVHVRTAKRVSNDYDVHAACDSLYLTNALGQYNKDRVHVVFADNMSLAKTMLPEGRNYRFIENESNYVDLFLMSNFKDYVISASTFGWWGAWLSKYENPSVTIMKNWFDPTKAKAYLNDNNITPDTWKKL
jgi:hypothetical protein